MAFSAALTLTDLSDYLAPSQLCILPVKMVEDTSAATTMPVEAIIKDLSAATTEISIDAVHGYFESSGVGKPGVKLKKAEITLNDCLACSGCITSAESVLVSMQSHEEVYRVIEERADLTRILSIAPQSVASLAALHDLSLEETMRGLRIFFKQQLGFKLVFDTTFARSISLAENRLEFLERRAHASKTLRAKSTADSIVGPLPILSSACPGWICYAEKTHGELLPFVSQAKSSQAIMGTLIKSGPVAKTLSIHPDEIYHVSVMPCYDKKLEASRPDFTVPATSPLAAAGECREVDCVLTTGEVQKMLDDKGLSLAQLALGPVPSSLAKEDAEGGPEAAFFPALIQAEGTSSGGYLFNTIKAVLETLEVDELYRTKLVEKKVRSEDYIEYTLVASGIASTSTLPDAILSTSPKVLLRAAKCYGFRNLQNVVRKIGRDSNISVTKGAAARPLPAAISSASSSLYANDSNASSTSSLVTSSALARRNLATARRKKAAGGEEGDKAFDYVEVMACPSGCVNGGGQIAPPKLPQEANRRDKILRQLKLDEEGMPDVSDSMDREEDVEMRVRESKILSGKEWVDKVEEIYWSSTTSSPATSLSESTIDLALVDSSILPYILSSESTMVKLAMAQTIENLVTAGAGSKNLTRSDWLRTSYRAVEDGEVNGLAVKW